MFNTCKKITTIAVLLTALVAGMSMAAEPVNVNTATAEQIALNITGIGAAKAEAIVAYREQHGPFQHVDELVNVKGIGLATVDKNRDLLRVDSNQ